MPRSTNSPAAKARKKRIFKQTKGYRGCRKNVYTVSKNALQKGLLYAYRDRKNKKRTFRSLWIQRINAAVRTLGMNYRDFMCALKSKGIMLNRKVLADLAMNEPALFQSVVEKAT